MFLSNTFHYFVFPFAAFYFRVFIFALYYHDVKISQLMIHPPETPTFHKAEFFYLIRMKVSVTPVSILLIEQEDQGG